MINRHCSLCQNILFKKRKSHVLSAPYGRSIKYFEHEQYGYLMPRYILQEVTKNGIPSLRRAAGKY